MGSKLSNLSVGLNSSIMAAGWSLKENWKSGTNVCVMCIEW